MSILKRLITKDNLMIVLKRMLIIFLIVLGIMLAGYFLQAIFNLGVYVGTFLRGLYNLVC